MKKLLIFLIFSIFATSSESIDDDDKEREYAKFINKKNLGLAICINEFYENLPKEIKDGYKAFNNIEAVNPRDGYFLKNFIKKNITNYLPNFKDIEQYEKYQPWYYIACINMYNDKKYEDFVKNIPNVY